MSGPQFVHVETHSRKVPVLRTKREAALASEGVTIQRKLTVEEICAEAARLPGSYPHVEHAIEPVVLFGVSPDRVPALLEDRIKEVNAGLRERRAAQPTGTSDKGLRAHRNDSQSLYTMVSSYPIPWQSEDGRNNYESAENEALLHEWVEANMEWAQKLCSALGIDLKSVVIHFDEPYPHLHFLGIPAASDINPRMDARLCHPGHRAKALLKQEEGEGDKEFKRRQNAAYIEAMRGFQDYYYEEVGRDAGLLRTGPRRRRLVRGEWLAEKKAAKSRALDVLHSKALHAKIAAQKVMMVDQATAAAKIEQEAAVLVETKQRLDLDLSSVRGSLEATLRIGSAVQEKTTALERNVDDLTTEKATLEADIAALRLARNAEELALQRQRDEIDAARLELSGKERELKKEQARLAAQYADKERKLDLIVEGIEAYAEGHIKFQGHDATSPLTYDRNAPNAEAARDKLREVKPQLEGIIRKLDKRLTVVADVISESVSAWASGLLKGVGEPNANGQPTFFLDDTKEADELLKRIEPFRNVVGKVVGMLPDRDLVDWLRKGLQRLTSMLTRAEKEEAAQYERTMIDLVKSKSNERG